MAILFNLILSMMITLRQFETKRRQKRPRQEREVKKRRIDLCLQSTPFVRYLFSPLHAYIRLESDLNSH